MSWRSGRNVLADAVNPVVETLENRQLLSTTVAMVDGTLSITGDSGDNVIRIFINANNPDKLNVRADGTTTRWNLDEILRIKVNARGGHDHVYVDRVNGAVKERAIFKGGSGHDTLVGGSRDDKLLGGSGDDEIDGSSGDDDLDGGRGDDELVGRGGDDDCSGEAGHDTLKGGSGSDDLYGGGDEDKLRGGGGEDFFRGKSSERKDESDDDAFWDAVDEMEEAGGDLPDAFWDAVDAAEASGVNFGDDFWQLVNTLESHADTGADQFTDALNLLKNAMGGTLTAEVQTAFDNLIATRVGSDAYYDAVDALEAALGDSAPDAFYDAIDALEEAGDAKIDAFEDLVDAIEALYGGNLPDAFYDYVDLVTADL